MDLVAVPLAAASNGCAAINIRHRRRRRSSSSGDQHAGASAPSPHWKHPARSSSSSSSSSSGRRIIALALALALLLAAPIRPAAASAEYNAGRYNQVCRYTATNVSLSLFKNGLDGGLEYLFPLEQKRAVGAYARPWQACFGPGEAYDVRAIAAGAKLPCRWSVSPAPGGSGGEVVDYEEEHACDVLLKSNCYCYAINRFVGSYCEPGLGGTGAPFRLPVLDCSKPTAGVVADGGRPVDRATVYSGRPAEGHYIALAVKPPSEAGDSGDFHFWRLDSNGAWSYKAGDTLVRNTLRTGRLITDIEADAAARGVYTKFCGYFHVAPATHKLVGNNFWYSPLPVRFNMWRKNGVSGRATPLRHLPAAWLAAYHQYFADNGWEDGERGAPAAGWPTAAEGGDGGGGDDDAGGAAGDGGAANGGGDNKRLDVNARGGGAGGNSNSNGGGNSNGSGNSGAGAARPRKERAFMPRGGAPAAAAASTPFVQPHWYSVRPAAALAAAGADSLREAAAAVAPAAEAVAPHSGRPSLSDAPH